MPGDTWTAAVRPRIRRRLAAVLAGLLVAVGALAVVAVEPASSASSPGKAGALFGVRTTRKLVALSFDDGPDPRWTPHVLDLLAARGGHATFFQIGDNALAHRDLVARVLASGGEIGNHTLDHPHLTDLTTA